MANLLNSNILASQRVGYKMSSRRGELFEGVSKT